MPTVIASIHKLHNTKVQSVIVCFENNWYSIKEEWVQGFKSQSLTLGETTNNFLESINSKVKSVFLILPFFINF